MVHVGCRGKPKMNSIKELHSKAKRCATVCLMCTGDEPYIGQRYRVIQHIVNHHLSKMTDDLFCCNLCGYCSLTKEQMESHPTYYKPHKFLVDQAKSHGEDINEDFFKMSGRPIAVLPEYTLNLSQTIISSNS